MNRIFVLRGDLVVNAVIVEPNCGWVAPDDCWTMLIPDDCPAWIGWRYVDGQWIAPPPPEPELIIEDNVQNIQ